jgi:hypothetical protein
MEKKKFRKLVAAAARAAVLGIMTDAAGADPSSKPSIKSIIIQKPVKTITIKENYPELVEPVRIARPPSETGTDAISVTEPDLAQSNDAVVENQRVVEEPDLDKKMEDVGETLQERIELGPQELEDDDTEKEKEIEEK